MKKSLNYLLDDIADQISNGWNHVNDIQSHVFQGHSSDEYDDESEFDELQFSSILDRLYTSLCAAIETLALPELLTDFKSEYTLRKDKKTNLSMLPYIGDLHSETLGLFWRYYKTISSLVGRDIAMQLNEEKRKKFERILINTPKIIKDRDMDPKNEAEVRKCVYDLLIHIFPDTVREIPVSHVTKTYKPDIGVKSLKCAAEYKYADSDTEVKKSIGGFYEDMKGYAGSEDWKFFYAVIYMTDAFFTEDQIKAEFDATGVENNWKPILVIGKGQRAKKKKV
jgi:hypothetical protein